MQFEPTRSFAYRFSRYVLLPELQHLPEVQSGDPFRLRDLAWPLIDGHLTPEQQSIRLKRVRSEGDETMGSLSASTSRFLLRNSAFSSILEMDISAIKRRSMYLMMIWRTRP
jgi:hypothetical protein